MALDYKLMKEKLYSGVVADILDQLGYKNQAMDPGIHPLKDDDVVVGPAFTVLAVDVFDEPEKPYEMEFKSVDALSKDEVLVATTNGSVSSGFWGELLTTAAVGHGATGCVLDGLSRDTRVIRKMNFSLFLRGTNLLDSKGRTDVIRNQCTITCGGVTVRPGDVIFGDYDGVVVIPKEVAEECVKLAFEKVSAENVVRDELLAGASAEEVYNKYHMEDVKAYASGKPVYMCNPEVWEALNVIK